jgi:hypothetical protein
MLISDTTVKPITGREPMEMEMEMDISVKMRNLEIGHTMD